MQVKILLNVIILFATSWCQQDNLNKICHQIKEKPCFQRKSVWLDVDTGNDDSMAIITTLFNDKLSLVGLSTTFGNTNLEYATSNTIKMLSAFGILDIPVIKGASKPLIHVDKQQDTVHGNLGMFGAEELKELFNPIMDEYEGIASIYSHLKDHYLTKKQKTTIIVLGPQTNMARLLISYPYIQDYISEIIFMGGAITQGNISPYSEFNAWKDAEAIQIVIEETFKRQIKLTMVPLDVTEQVKIELDHIHDIKKMPGYFSQWVGSLIERLRITTLAYSHPHPTLHDAIAVAYVLNPEMFEGQQLNITINLDAVHYGQTEVISSGKPNTFVLTKVDISSFWVTFFQGILSASQCADDFASFSS